ncbi:MAG: LytR C-terminal domain-containing protein, partial [Solirubrobacteraceae bacterium]
RPAPAMPVRAGAPSASPRRTAPTLPPRRPAPPASSSSSHGGRRWAIAGGVVAVIAALGVYAATQLLGDDKTNTPNQAATPTASATQSTTASNGGSGSSSPTRAQTTVAVFNGTTINGLASQTADKLASSGYKRGSTGDFTDQQRAASTVFYRRAARTQARNIARELNISDLRPMDAETQALAGARADVAVVVGSDKAP